MRFERAAMLAGALALGIYAGPMMAQQTTTQSTTTTTTTNSSDYETTPRPHHVSKHQLKKDEKADKAQAKADKAQAKLAGSHEMHQAEEKQQKADAAADKANNPYK